MTGKEALESLFGFAVFETDCSLDQCKKCNDKLKHYCAYRDYEIVEQDLDVLEAFKNALIIECMPPKPFEPNKLFNVEDYKDYIVKYNNYNLNKEIREKLTQWLINNIDKETVREWLENGK